jgi:hypothetical protein
VNKIEQQLYPGYLALLRSKDREVLHPLNGITGPLQRGFAAPPTQLTNDGYWVSIMMLTRNGQSCVPVELHPESPLERQLSYSASGLQSLESRKVYADQLQSSSLPVFSLLTRRRSYPTRPLGSCCGLAHARLDNRLSPASH